jgi:peptidoglycan hydrolase-like protein with peptidoglycan-binding domain
MKFYTGKIDSYYGSQTEAAVVKIQIQGGLKGSGIIDD